MAVRWKWSGADELGYVCNLSSTGFCVRTRQIHAPGFRQLFSLSLAGEDVEVEAKVVWTRQVQIESEFGAWHEMGLALVGAAPAEFARLVGRVAAPDDERRTSPRYPQAVSVKIISTAGEFRSHSIDVSKGGLFIQADRYPAVGEQVRLEMDLPGNVDPVCVKAEVVRAIWQDNDTRPSGFAVRFRELSDAETAAFLNYLKIVKELNYRPSARGAPEAGH